ncbi:MAG: class I SAM-dependent DNA methyltransferase [Kouleothrix sp.]|nr:class I SAM-dependent DNA methyltransferase [Kouleothrix sp.]
MTDAAAARAFIDHWERVEINEKAVAQSHFNDLCHLLGLRGPVEADPKGRFYRFEKPLTKSGGSAGFADVWYKDRFAWEYKTKGKYSNLSAAYQQLLLYKEDLDNPPVLVACDIASYEVHIAFTGYQTRVVKFTNAELENASNRELLRLVFTDPEQLRPVDRQETITKKAAERFAQVAGFLEKRGFAPGQIAPFFMKVLFALFAEDIRILPGELMTQGIKQAIFKPSEFVPRTQALFRTMHAGGYFGQGDRVPQFNGWLFKDDEVLSLNADELTFLAEAAKLDWSQVDPSIFGTLFERSLDPAKRAQLGLHYTSRDDILLIVEPVLMAPLRREWAEVQAGTEALRGHWEVEGTSANQRRKLQSVAEGMLLDFMERLSKVRVLDPACGSGNFLYVALNELKNLEKEVWSYAGGLGLQQPELQVSPAQLHGIEKNQFAAELAQVVVWIGYLQWKRANGFFDVQEPILQTLHNIECRDAILTVGLDGQPAEPAWPEVDVIVGNPPFLGGNRIRKGLGDTYVDTLFGLYDGRVPAFADLVCYWFERTRALVAKSNVKRAGLLATQGIRGGANRKVLERIKETGDIFWAQSDRNWVLDGAMVHVSMVGFDDGTTQVKELDGRAVSEINADLTASVDLTAAPRLLENRSICFQGASAKAPFDIDSEVATTLLADVNKSGRHNSDVIRPVKGALELVSTLKPKWTIDFGLMPLEEASEYCTPFEYVRQNVLPVRLHRRDDYRGKWWQYGRPRPEMRNALAGLHRYIATPAHSKHRLFVWISPAVLCNQATLVFAREDDYFFGVLHSILHELWARAKGTQLREAESGFRYTPTTTFETFPFPWPPGKEDQADPKVQAIAEAARALVRLRDAWLAGGEPRGLSGSAIDLPGSAIGLSGNADGLSGSAIGLSGSAIGLSGSAIGLSGNADGLSGNADGLSGSAIGLSGSAIGLSGNADGLSGSAIGLSGSAIGLSGSAIGLSGNADGLSGNADGLSGNADGLPDKPHAPSPAAGGQGSGVRSAFTPTPTPHVPSPKPQAPSPKPQGPHLKDRTLTNLYNKRPDWLAEAHKRLDAAVFDGYGWPHGLSDDEILARLLALNLERAAGQGQVATMAGGEEESDGKEYTLVRDRTPLDESRG